jgi:hypothetical protein
MLRPIFLRGVCGGGELTIINVLINSKMNRK